MPRAHFFEVNRRGISRRRTMMKTFLTLGFGGILLATIAGCSSATGSAGASQLDSDLNTIRSGYVECVNDLGPDAPQCKSLADGLHQLADQIGSAQSTAGRIKAEDAARHSMDY
jgi:hypothetical protein